MRINLYTTFYRPQDSARFEELTTALRKNLELQSIDRVFLLLEDEIDLPSPETDKVHCEYLSGVPTFNDFFDLVNRTTAPDDINIVANTDIHFDQSIDKLRSIKMRGKLFALARWEKLNGAPFSLEGRLGSQDSWIFEGPMRELDAEFYIGQWACDNRLAYLFKDAGYRVTNPALDLRSYHIHQSDFRAKRSTSADLGVPGLKVEQLPVTSTDRLPVRLFKLISGEYRIRPYLYSLSLFWAIRMQPGLERVLGKKLVGKLRGKAKSMIWTLK